MTPRVRLPLAPVAAAAALAACLWLSVSGTVVVEDRGGLLAEAAVVSGVGRAPLHRVPGGLWVGLPGPDGTIELVARAGARRQIGYVTAGEHLWLSVPPVGGLGAAKELGSAA